MRSWDKLIQVSPAVFLYLIHTSTTKPRPYHTSQSKIFTIKWLTAISNKWRQNCAGVDWYHPSPAALHFRFWHTSQEDAEWFIGKKVAMFDGEMILISLNYHIEDPSNKDSILPVRLGALTQCCCAPIFTSLPTLVAYRIWKWSRLHTFVATSWLDQSFMKAAPYCTFNPNEICM
jgi:hypothetical protein